MSETSSLTKTPDDAAYERVLEQRTFLRNRVRELASQKIHNNDLANRPAQSRTGAILDLLVNDGRVTLLNKNVLIANIRACVKAGNSIEPTHVFKVPPSVEYKYRKFEANAKARDAFNKAVINHADALQDAITLGAYDGTEGLKALESMKSFEPAVGVKKTRVKKEKAAPAAAPAGDAALLGEEPKADGDKPKATAKKSTSAKSK